MILARKTEKMVKNLRTDTTLDVSPKAEKVEKKPTDIYTQKAGKILFCGQFLFGLIFASHPRGLWVNA